MSSSYFQASDTSAREDVKMIDTRRNEAADRSSDKIRNIERSEILFP